MEKFKAKFIVDDDETICLGIFKNDCLIMNAGENELIFKAFYEDIKWLNYNSGILKITDIDEIEYTIACSNDVYDELKTRVLKLRASKKNVVNKTRELKEEKIEVVQEDIEDNQTNKNAIKSEDSFTSRHKVLSIFLGIALFGITATIVMKVNEIDRNKKNTKEETERAALNEYYRLESEARQANNCANKLIRMYLLSGCGQANYSLEYGSHVFRYYCYAGLNIRISEGQYGIYGSYEPIYGNC